MNILYFWISIALIFLIIEFSTATFYGLALSLAAGVVALYVFFIGDVELNVIQGIIFALSSLIFAYTLPRLLTTHSADVPQGFDKYIGEKRKAKRVAGELKISLDGVDYIIDSEDDIVPSDTVEVIGHKGTGMKVKKIQASS